MAGVKSQSLKCKDLHDYLKTLSSATLEKLFNHPATCLAVFRELPTLSRHYVTRLLFVEQPVPQAVIGSWLGQQYVKQHLEAVEALCELHIYMEYPVPGGLPGWILNTTFRKNLKIALLGGGKPWAVCANLEKDKHGRDIKFLDTYAMERWEALLHFMVGSKQSENTVSNDAIKVLLHSGLMRKEDESNIITTEGFQFLLMTTASQVWHFMLQYLDTVEERGLNLVDCLTFLFQLSFLTLGKDYSTGEMGESMLMFLQHLRELGIVYQRKRRSGRFYPTRLAINLASGLKEVNLDVNKTGYIVVETNYRVYAYTDSHLQIALIALFCEMMYRFPNFSVGVFTRESVREALKSGITADQIVKFLQMHAHPEMLKQKPVLPPTVVDQIRLWEIERDRFKFTEGVLYSQFLSQSDFELLCNYAQDLGVLIFSNPARRVMLVSKGGHDDVKRFWKRHRQDH